jgi:hypothetical protein
VADGVLELDADALSDSGGRPQAVRDGRVLLPDPSEAARIAFGLEIRDRLREPDPSAFETDTWWGRGHEEVGLDAVRRASPSEDGPGPRPRTPTVRGRERRTRSRESGN